MAEGRGSEAADRGSTMDVCDNKICRETRATS